MANIPYYQQKDIENIKKLREMMKALPPFCTEFFRGLGLPMPMTYLFSLTF